MQTEVHLSVYQHHHRQNHKHHHHHHYSITTTESEQFSFVIHYDNLSAD